jgi:predicted 3-demethylubiquinone-9 3-methyltransferase (glyoxalase superfamily)
MQKITPFFWLREQQAETAARFYVGILPNSRIVSTSPMATTFELEGQRFVALNGNPGFDFTEALSLHIECADQAEIDRLWGALTADGGSPGRCGWCKDRFGVSWQVVPKQLPDLLGNPRVVEAMLQMSKLDIAELQRANKG